MLQRFSPSANANTHISSHAHTHSQQPPHPPPPFPPPSPATPRSHQYHHTLSPPPTLSPPHTKFFMRSRMPQAGPRKLWRTTGRRGRGGGFLERGVFFFSQGGGGLARPSPPGGGGGGPPPPPPPPPPACSCLGYLSPCCSWDAHSTCGHCFSHGRTRKRLSFFPSFSEKLIKATRTSCGHLMTRHTL